MQTVLMILGGAFLGVLVLAILAGLVWVYLDLRRQTKALTLSLSGLGSMGEVPAYIQGLVKVCEDQVKSVIELKQTVDKFHGSMFGPEKDNDKAAWQPYSDSAADMAYEVEELVRQGFSASEAKERVSNSFMEAKRRQAEEMGRFRLA